MKGMRNPTRPVGDLESQAVPSVNWKLLKHAVNGGPQLMWTSITAAAPFKEMDSLTLPILETVEARYLHANANKKSKSDPLLGCQAFWEDFRRSQLVIIFDRYADDTCCVESIRSSKPRGHVRCKLWCCSAER